MSTSASAVPAALAGERQRYTLEAPSQNSEVDEPATAFSGIKINQNTIEYRIGPALANETSEGFWVMWGSQNVYAKFVRTGGTESDWGSSPGALGDRFLLTSTRTWHISNSSNAASKTIIGYFELYLDSTGGSPVHTTSTSTWTATVNSSN